MATVICSLISDLQNNDDFTLGQIAYSIPVYFGYTYAHFIQQALWYYGVFHFIRTFMLVNQHIFLRSIQPNIKKQAARYIMQQKYRTFRNEQEIIFMQVCVSCMRVFYVMCAINQRVDIYLQRWLYHALEEQQQQKKNRKSTPLNEDYTHTHGRKRKQKKNNNRNVTCVNRSIHVLPLNQIHPRAMKDRLLYLCTIQIVRVRLRCVAYTIVLARRYMQFCLFYKFRCD